MSYYQYSRSQLRALADQKDSKAEALLEKKLERDAKTVLLRKEKAQAAGFGSVSSLGYAEHVGGEEAVAKRQAQIAESNRRQTERERAAREAGEPGRHTLGDAMRRGGPEAVAKLRQALQRRRMTQKAFQAELSVRPRGLHLMLDCPALLQER
jgi:hypothetical protein